MSSDNCVIILQTDGPEYRVAHIMAPENYKYDEEKEDYTEDPDVLIKNARKYWEGCKVFTDKNDAYAEAERIYGEVGWTEYGLFEVLIERKF